MSIFDDPQILASLTEGQIKALRNYEQAQRAQMQADTARAQAHAHLTEREVRRLQATRELREFRRNRPVFGVNDLLAIADEPTHVLNLRSSTDRLLASIASADDLIANPD
ncbi:hypothetical protein UFOVP706_56 [uncultured Caudovirales phage]|uniref:Uncharacterized protein n=1 Tax=uncultured Caudovirales phage TaxID=2100421 RepID=A0A6J5NJV3_9CAUD|nr:hypothetical protein UFOVP706_56 [uncultured Caudovirales phage]